MKHTRAYKLVCSSNEKNTDHFKSGDFMGKSGITILSPTCLAYYSDNCQEAKHTHSKMTVSKNYMSDIVVRKLIPPFLKVEDSSGCYRQQVLEMDEWPKLHFHGHDSPFYNPSKRTSKKHYLRKSVCELCSTSYYNQKGHLKSSEHQNNAKNDLLFASLDKAIAEGTSVYKFLKKYIKMS